MKAYTFTASGQLGGEPVELTYEYTQTLAHTSWVDVFDIKKASINGRPVDINDDTDLTLISQLEDIATKDFFANRSKTISSDNSVAEQQNTQA